MPRKRKKQEEDVVKKTAPNVEVKIIDDIKPEVDPIIDPQQEPVNDFIDNVDIDKNIINNTKRMLFEPSPNNKKTLVINKKMSKKQSPNELAEIKTRLTLRPLISNYKKSRIKKGTGISLSFKVGRERIH